MATKVDMWRSDDGQLHYNEAAADASNARIRRRKVIMDMLKAPGAMRDQVHVMGEDAVSEIIDFLDDRGPEIAAILMRGR